MLPGFEALEDNEQMGFGADPSRRILLMERKRSDWITAVEIIRMLRGVMPMLGATTQDWSILLDTRAAIGRTDEDFETEAARLREYMLENFARVAVLVRSAAGEMQVERFTDPKARMAVFREIPEALRFAAARVIPTPARR